MNTQRGFTFIELLVAISIIGLLSSIVLAALTSARLKARDSSAVASMSMMRSEANSVFDESSETYPTDLCSVVFAELIDGINAQTPQDVQCGFGDGGDYARWAASVLLNSGLTFCVDSTGYAGSGNESNGSCTGASS